MWGVRTTPTPPNRMFYWAKGLLRRPELTVKPSRALSSPLLFMLFMVLTHDCLIPNRQLTDEKAVVAPTLSATVMKYTFHVSHRPFDPPISGRRFPSGRKHTTRLYNSSLPQTATILNALGNSQKPSYQHTTQNNWNNMVIIIHLT